MIWFTRRVRTVTRGQLPAVSRLVFSIEALLSLATAALVRFRSGCRPLGEVLMVFPTLGPWICWVRLLSMSIFSLRLVCRSLCSCVVHSPCLCVVVRVLFRPVFCFVLFFDSSTVRLCCYRISIGAYSRIPSSANAIARSVSHIYTRGLLGNPDTKHSRHFTEMRTTLGATVLFFREGLGGRRGREGLGRNGLLNPCRRSSIVLEDASLDPLQPRR